MNGRQWTILFLVLALFALFELFPPWLHYCERNGWYPAGSAGYSFVTKPPQPIESPCTSDPIRPLTILRKNSGRLNVQRATIIFLASGLLLLMKRRRTNLSIAIASLVLCLGLFGLFYF